VENEGAMNVMSVSLLRLENGNIALFYLRKNSETECIPIMRISTDEARTWSEPVICITDRKGFFVLNNDRVIQLKNGRLLMPVAQHNDETNPEMQERAKIWCYYSDDSGATWHCSAEVPNPSGIVSQEPGVVELKDGSVMMIIRASDGSQQISHSADNGMTWSPMYAGDIPSPLSPASVARIPSTDDLILVWNNNGNDQLRTPLTVAISDDEGKTWRNIKNIEDDPERNGCYCYTAIHFYRKKVLLAYCTGEGAWDLATTVITVLPVKWLYE
jgi:predicted neuraminidase